MKHFVFLTLLSFSALAFSSSRTHLGVHHTYVNMSFNNPDHLEGYLTGIKLGYEWQYRCYFTGLEFESFWDIVPLSGQPCQRSRLEEYFTEWRIGWAASACSWTFRPYIGFGWNYFRNKQDPDAHGLNFIYNKLFIPIGVQICRPLWTNLSVGMNFEWRPDIYATLRIAGSTFRIASRHAVRLEVPLGYCFQWCWCGCPKIEFIPLFNWNCFGHTRSQTSLNVPFGLPDLTLWELGLRIQLTTRF